MRSLNRSGSHGRRSVNHSSKLSSSSSWPMRSRGRQVEVMLALGTDVEPALGLLAKDGGLALRTANPQPFRHAPFRPSSACHASLRLTRFHVSIRLDQPSREVGPHHSPAPPGPCRATKKRSETAAGRPSRPDAGVPETAMRQAALSVLPLSLISTAEVVLVKLSSPDLPRTRGAAPAPSPNNR